MWRGGGAVVALRLLSLHSLACEANTQHEGPKTIASIATTPTATYAPDPGTA